jgi:hypothetical protein
MFKVIFWRDLVVTGEIYTQYPLPMPFTQGSLNAIQHNRCTQDIIPFQNGLDISVEQCFGTQAYPGVRFDVEKGRAHCSLCSKPSKAMSATRGHLCTIAHMYKADEYLQNPTGAFTYMQEAVPHVSPPDREYDFPEGAITVEVGARIMDHLRYVWYKVVDSPTHPGQRRVACCLCAIKSPTGGILKSSEYLTHALDTKHMRWVDMLLNDKFGIMRYCGGDPVADVLLAQAAGYTLPDDHWLIGDTSDTALAKAESSKQYRTSGLTGSYAEWCNVRTGEVAYEPAVPNRRAGREGRPRGVGTLVIGTQPLATSTLVVQPLPVVRGAAVVVRRGRHMAMCRGAQP